MKAKNSLFFAVWICLTARLAAAEPNPSLLASGQPLLSGGFQSAEKIVPGADEKELGEGLMKNLGPCQIIKGDINGNKFLDLDDIVLLSNCIFLGTGGCAACYVGDTNCDGALSPSDIVKLILAIYLDIPVLC